MRRNAIKYIYPASPFYVRWKKHFCPKCGGKLSVGYTSEIVNAQSPRSKDYDFSSGDTFLTGDVEFRTRCFHCVSCQTDISISHMKQLERERRR